MFETDGDATRVGATAVYLDNHATTRLDPRVLEMMLPTFSAAYGNAASFQHRFGRAAFDLVEQARARIAHEVGVRPAEVFFTSGATESNNLAIFGLLRGSSGAGLVTSMAEHKSILDSAEALRSEGHPVTLVPVDQFGHVDLDGLTDAITRETRLVSIMAANNEVGTISRLEEIAKICAERGVLFHSDATQAFGRIPLRLGPGGVDLLSISAHKVYGPKGVGALIVRRGVELRPLIYGGGHERGVRSGTLNVPGCVGFGEACRIAAACAAEEAVRCMELRDRLQDQILTAIPEARVNGHPANRLPGNLNLCFPGEDADDLMLAMPDVAASSGSACTAASPAPSHVLLAMGLSYEDAGASIRFGVGRFNTIEEIDYAAGRVVATVLEARGRSGRPKQALA